MHSPGTVVGPLSERAPFNDPALDRVPRWGSVAERGERCLRLSTAPGGSTAPGEVSLGLLDGHIRGCVRDEIKAGGGEAKVDELLEVMDRVLRR